MTWEVCKHRNSFVFEGAQLSIPFLLETIRDECGLWCLVGASGPLEVVDPSSLGLMVEVVDPSSLSSGGLWV